jgi:hypothetical protein
VHVDIPKLVIRPVLVPVVSFLIAAFCIITIGETLINLFDADFSSEMERKELWFGTILALVILGIGAFIVTRPHADKKGVLDRQVVIGRKPMFAESVSPVEQRMRSGGRGLVSDITEGYTLYARNGEFARVLGLMPGGTEAGRTFKGYIYAEGVRGANKELWIPVEAVLDVYPETHAAFLAIMGDETEAFGWNNPPQSFNRAKVAKELPKTL